MHPDEAFGIVLESLAQDMRIPALAGDLLCLAVVEHFRCEQADAAVMVLGVVPVEENLAEDVGALDRPKALGELRLVLQGF